jgi:hypothetical protein
MRVTSRYFGGEKEPEEVGIDVPLNGNGNGNGNGGLVSPNQKMENLVGFNLMVLLVPMNQEKPKLQSAILLEDLLV